MMKMELRIGLSTLRVMRDVIIAPMTVFDKTRDGGLAREAVILFGTCVLITVSKAFSKSFTVPERTVNFFVTDSLNEVLSFLGHPLITLLFFYLVYGVFLMGIFLTSRSFNKETRVTPFIISLMTVSAIGIITQVVFYASTSFLPKQALVLGRYAVYCWVVVLSVLAIRESLRLSVWHSIICFLVPFLVLLSVGVQLGVAPYLSWLGT